MAEATLTISSRNYSSWPLRGWLICRMAGLDFDLELLSGQDESTRAELLHLSPSFLVPRLSHGTVSVWDTLAIAEYLGETFSEAGLLPKTPVERARCRSISGEMHCGFLNLRSALPMNLRAASGLQDLQRRARRHRADHRDPRGLPVALGRPLPFRGSPIVADTMYAPVAMRFCTYDAPLPFKAETYRDTILAWDLMREWAAAAESEPDEIDMEF